MSKGLRNALGAAGLVALLVVAAIPQAAAEDTPPGAPENVAVTDLPEGLRLTWSPPSGQISVGSYAVFRAEGDQAFLELVVVAGYEFSFLDRNVELGHYYSYYILAKEQGVPGPPSVPTPPTARAAMMCQAITLGGSPHVDPGCVTRFDFMFE